MFKILENIDKNDKKIKNESFREFYTNDYANWGGIVSFPDGSSPLIYEGKHGTMIIGGDESDPDVTEIYFYFPISKTNNEPLANGWKLYTYKEDAIADGELYLSLMDKECDVTQLDRLGFEVMDFSNKLNEDVHSIKEDHSFLKDTRTKVNYFLNDELINSFESNLALQVASKIKSYDPDWCPADASEIKDELDEARKSYIRELLNILFQNVNGYEESKLFKKVERTIY